MGVVGGGHAGSGTRAERLGIKISIEPLNRYEAYLSPTPTRQWRTSLRWTRPGWA